MSGTRQLYPSTVRNRRTLSYNDDYFYDDVPNYIVTRSPRVPTSYNSLGQRTNLHPHQNQLREARLKKFLATYDKDKEAYLVKQKEKERKKILDKLKRYEGVGELGNKMTGEEVTEEDKYDGYWRARDTYQHTHDHDAIVAAEDRSNREREEKEKKAEEMQKKLEELSDDVSGLRLGGDGQYQRVRGDHPLLARLSGRNND